MNKIQILNRDALKYIALIAMTFSHISHVLLEPNTTLYIIFDTIGNFTAITMVYLLVEGFQYTKSKTKYAQRLLLYGLLSQPLFYLMVKPLYTFNIMFSLLICFLIMCCIETKSINIIIKTVFIFLLIFASLYCDWSFILPIGTLGFYFSKGNKLSQGITFVVIILIAYMASDPVSNAAMRLMTISIPIACSAVACLLLYNHKQSTKYRTLSKHIFYLYYPIHIGIIMLIKYLCY